MRHSGLIKENYQILTILLRCLDVIAVMFSGVLVYFYKFGLVELQPHYLKALFIAGLFTGIIFYLFQIYESVRARSISQHISTVLQAILTVFVFLAGLAFITKKGESFSREWFLIWMGSSILLVLTFRCGFLFFLHVMRSKGWNERRVIVIGGGELAAKLVHSIQQSVWTGFRIVDIFDDQPEFKLKNIGGITVSETPKDINQYLDEKNGNIDEVWLALPLSAENRVREILYQLRFQTINTRFVLDIFGLDLLNHSISDFAGFPVLNIRTTPMVGINRLIKAIEDRALALSILLLISPLLVVIAIAVKLSSPGPVFYRQKRVGWNGKEFEMLKFRTMPINAESQTGPVWAKQNEDRATAVGSFLRRTSLDELPQFINVLCGDMSIVGPRPERAYFVEQFKDQVPRYMQKHVVKAGITGWAQVNGWRGNTDLSKRIEYDLFYIENWSLLFDIKIILLTILHGFVNKNAY